MDMVFCPQCGKNVSSDTDPCHHCGFRFTVVIADYKHGIHKISNIQDFFPFAIHIIYGIILTLSYEIANKIFIPINELLTFDKFLNAFGLIAIYIFVVSGWIGYTKSIIHYPHKDNNYGISRFMIELIITFLVFYLLNLSSMENFKDHYSEAFIWVVPIMFMFYLIWDLMKYGEYRIRGDNSHEAKARNRVLEGRSIRTIYALFAVLGLSFFYDLAAGLITPEVKISQSDAYLIFIPVLIAITILYRRSKWEMGGKRTKKTAIFTNR